MFGHDGGVHPIGCQILVAQAGAGQFLSAFILAGLVDLHEFVVIAHGLPPPAKDLVAVATVSAPRPSLHQLGSLLDSINAHRSVSSMTRRKLSITLYSTMK
jgi:hypothetical protein